MELHRLLQVHDAGQVKTPIPSDQQLIVCLKLGKLLRSELAEGPKLSLQKVLKCHCAFRRSQDRRLTPQLPPA